MHCEAYELWKEATAEMTDEEKELFAQEILAEAKKLVEARKLTGEKTKEKEMSMNDYLGRGAAIGAGAGAGIGAAIAAPMGYKRMKGLRGSPTQVAIATTTAALLGSIIGAAGGSLPGLAGGAILGATKKEQKKN
jgi:hypothetical protein